MQQRLMFFNLIFPLFSLLLLGFIPQDLFLLPDFVILALVLFTIGRAFLLLQQQTVFAVLPGVLLSLPEGWLVLDMFAPFATLSFLIYLWFVNLQWGQRPWLHWLHIINLLLLGLFVGLSMRVFPIGEAILKYNELPIVLVTTVFALTPLLLIFKWRSVGRWAGYWPLLMPVAFAFDWSSANYLLLWVSLASLFSLTVDAYIMAFVDELTGILGRRALMFKLKTVGKRYSLVMVDVDHFKSFNDKHGHQVGDDVLKVVAKLISETSGATAYRYGGEEFILLFAKGQQQDLEPYVEETRERLAEYALYPKSIKRDKKQRGKPRKRKPLHVTASFGLASHKSGESIEEVIERADKALYKAKKKGRNCLVMSK